jgi:hypothetical protein
MLSHSAAAGVSLPGSDSLPGRDLPSETAAAGVRLLPGSDSLPVTHCLLLPVRNLCSLSAAAGVSLPESDSLPGRDLPSETAAAGVRLLPASDSLPVIACGIYLL